MLMEDESSVEENGEEGMSMVQLEDILRQEEQGHKSAFDGMTNEQKYQVITNGSVMDSLFHVGSVDRCTPRPRP